MAQGSFDNKVGDSGQIDWETVIEQTPELKRARDYGVDVYQLIANVNRTVDERVERHRNALNSCDKFRKAILL